MYRIRFPRSRSFLSFLPAPVLLAGMLPILASCSTKAPTTSTAQAAFGTADLPSRRVRIGADHTGGRIMATVEVAADSIIKAASDPDVRRNALAWKANAIPAIQTATHHPDPLISFVDGWVLAVMMEDYFETGRGRDQFGPQQPVATNAMRNLVNGIESDTRRVLEESGSDDFARFYEFVHEWAATYPIDNDLYLHRTAAVYAADVLAGQQIGGLSSLGTMEEMALDAQTMARAYLAYTFKTVLWQTELMIESMMDTTLITPLLDSVDRMAITSTATRLLEATPDMIASERALILAETERMLEESLDRTFALVSEERAQIMADVEEMIARERAIIFEELEAMTPEIMGQVREEAISIADHVMLRLAIGIAILVLLVGLGWLIFRPRSRAT
ncbi:MAG: hypothetical protein P8125_12810 [Gemmatimonadota bacterium]